MKKTKVLCIVGPTASGKSALAVQLAKLLNGDVVSADSRQVYRELNIGTGKITKKEMQGVRHHLLDVASPKKIFTAHEFVVQGRKAIENIFKRGKLSIVTGGTGFYIDALVGRISLPNIPVDQKLRARLAKKSTAQLYAQLLKLDPKRADAIDRHNPVRLIRAIEIATQKEVSAPMASPPYDLLWIGIAPPLPVLEKKITARLKARMRAGMVAEARRLHAQGLSYKRMETLGLEYRFLSQYLQGQVTRNELEYNIRQGNRQYAKRQLTYWKRNNEIQWYAPQNVKKIRAEVKNWLKK